tara:strand:- start:279 stop:563 length:285 start_codon:yes stop_codon:yes gene_type:complete
MALSGTDHRGSVEALVALAEAAVQLALVALAEAAVQLALASTDHLGSVVRALASANQLALASTDHLGSVVRALAGLDLLEAVEVQEMVQMTALG